MGAVIVLSLLMAGGGVGQSYMYACSGTELVAVTFEDGYVRMQTVDGDITLLQGISASGARFTNGKMVFWVKGRRATWDKGTGKLLKCRVTDRG